MGAPGSGTKAIEQPAAETLLGAFKTIEAVERRKHATVLNYWLSIRGDKEFPPLHDLDPLELSDAGPSSVLLELISGGHDAEVRHVGATLKGEAGIERIIDAPNPSILASIAKKLPIVAISRDFLAFEDEFSDSTGATRCWVTLLPLSAGGAWVDYVYALVSFETEPAKGAKPAEKAAKMVEVEDVEVDQAALEETVSEEIEEPAEAVADEIDEAETVVEEIEPVETVAEAAGAEEALTKLDQVAAKAAPGFSKLFDSLAGLTGFYAQGGKAEAVATVVPEVSEEAAVVEEPAEELAAAQLPAEEWPAEESPAEEATAEESPAEEAITEEPPVEDPAAVELLDEPVVEQHASQAASASEGILQTKLTEVRAKADEARTAKLRANAALYEGLGAAYDFALDAEDSPEEYLKLVEAQGLKIQLRSPMTPVVKLAFSGLCDDSTIGQLEAVLGWALEQDLPRGSLAERIESAGGIGRILNGESQPSD